MAVYARPNNVASKCPTYSDLAPPPVAVKKGKADWLSNSAVRYALRLKKVGLTGLIVSVRGEPDTHSTVGTLPHEAAPLLDQMRKKGTPVRIGASPLHRNNSPRQLHMGHTTRVTDTPHFYVQR